MFIVSALLCLLLGRVSLVNAVQRPDTAAWKQARVDSRGGSYPAHSSSIATETSTASTKQNHSRVLMRSVLQTSKKTNHQSETIKETNISCAEFEGSTGCKQDGGDCDMVFQHDVTDPGKGKCKQCTDDGVKILPDGVVAAEEKFCEVLDGTWGEWDEWGECSSSCGGGDKFRLREVEAQPVNGGNEAEGAAEETQECNADPCATTTTVTYSMGEIKIPFWVIVYIYFLVYWPIILPLFCCCGCGCCYLIFNSGKKELPHDDLGMEESSVYDPS